MISVIGDIKGDDYKKFASFALAHSDAIMLIYCAYGYPLKKKIRDIRRMLRPFRIASRDNSKSYKKGIPEFEWPNTISRTKALICAETYRLSPEVKEFVLSVDNIFAWMYPERPEDLAFFYQGECWIATTAHEQLCNITDHEREIAKMLCSMGIEYRRSPGHSERFKEKYTIKTNDNSIIT